MARSSIANVGETVPAASQAGGAIVRAREGVNPAAPHRYVRKITDTSLLAQRRDGKVHSPWSGQDAAAKLAGDCAAGVESAGHI